MLRLRLCRGFRDEAEVEVGLCEHQLHPDWTHWSRAPLLNAVRVDCCRQTITYREPYQRMTVDLLMPDFGSS